MAHRIQHLISSHRFYGKLSQQEHCFNIHFGIIRNLHNQLMFSCFHLRKRNFADTVIYIPSFRAVFHSFPIQEYFCFLIIFHGKESSFQQSFCMNMEAQGQSMFESFHPVIGPWLCKRLHTKWISQLLTELIVNAENFFLRLPLPAVKSIFSQIQNTYIRFTADNLHLI